MAYYIYSIKHSSGKTYIGMSGCRPFFRWNDHVVELENDFHDNFAFRDFWKTTKLTEWNFSILEIIYTDNRNEAFEKEYWHVQSIPEEFRLNMPKKESKIFSIENTVVDDLILGMTHKKISEKYNISPATVNKIKKKNLDKILRGNSK